MSLNILVNNPMFDFRLECFVRQKLKQENILDGNLDIVRSKSNTEKVKHLRFDFDARNNELCSHNNHIVGLFNINVAIGYIVSHKGSIEFHYIEDYPDTCHHNHVSLELKVLEYTGHGTVEIIIDIIKRFGVKDT